MENYNYSISANGTQKSVKPTSILRTNRGLTKFFFLGLLTFGIYDIVVLSHISKEINLIATKDDGKDTMHFCLIAFIFSWLTFGIVPLIWQHNITARMENQLSHRQINYKFTTETFWLWGILGALLFGIGPFVYIHKMMKAMNLINNDFNQEGQ